MRRRILILLTAIVALGADTKDALVRRDVERLRGVWQVISYKEFGESVGPPEKVGWRYVAHAGWTYTFAGKTVSIQQSHQKVEKHTFWLDPTSKPPAFDLEYEAGPSSRGIYKMKGDTLTLCFDVISNGTARPKDFLSDNPNHVITVLKRVKK